MAHGHRASIHEEPEQAAFLDTSCPFGMSVEINDVLLPIAALSLVQHLARSLDVYCCFMRGSCRQCVQASWWKSRHAMEHRVLDCGGPCILDGGA